MSYPTYGGGTGMPQPDFNWQPPAQPATNQPYPPSSQPYPSGQPNSQGSNWHGASPYPAQPTGQAYPQPAGQAYPRSLEPSYQQPSQPAYSGGYPNCDQPSSPYQSMYPTDPAPYSASAPAPAYPVGPSAPSAPSVPGYSSSAQPGYSQGIGSSYPAYPPYATVGPTYDTAPPPPSQTNQLYPDFPNDAPSYSRMRSVSSDPIELTGAAKWGDDERPGGYSRPESPQRRKYSGYGDEDAARFDKDKAKNVTGDLFDFAKRHGGQIASAALSYKKGGKIGKAMAMNTAHDLYGDFKRENPGGLAGGGKSKQHSDYDRRDSRDGYPSRGSGGGGGIDGLLSSALSSGLSLVNKGRNKESAPSSGVKHLLQDGAVVQLISEATGSVVQMLKTLDGNLTLDALGPVSDVVPNAQFTILKQVNPTYWLMHNFNNYISISTNGVDIISAGHITDTSSLPSSCRLNFAERHPPGFLAIQSQLDDDIVLGFDSAGDLLNPRSVKTGDTASIMSVRVVSQP